MDAKTIEKISKQVYQRFPEMSGSQPRVQAQSLASASSQKGVTYLLTFRSNIKTADGKALTNIVRVVASDTGKIIKITTSR